MTLQHAVAPLPRRSRTSAPATEPLAPGRVAFLGSAYASTDGGEAIFVQSLCWPIVPTAWTALTEAWQVVRERRGEPSSNAATPSWLGNCAPQLGAPFRDTTAEESSVAALVVRTPMQIAITIGDAHGKPRNGTATGEVEQQQGLSHCLVTYAQFLRAPGRHPCSAIVSRSQGEEVDQRCLETFRRSRTHLSSADPLRDLQLRFWKEPVEPLPLELAHAAAASVVRHRSTEDIPNPVFDAVFTKLANTPFQLQRSVRLKRR